MKTQPTLVYFLIVVILAGCRGSGVTSTEIIRSASSQTESPTNVSTLSSAEDTETPSVTMTNSLERIPSETVVATETSIPTITVIPTDLPGSQMLFRCLDVVPEIPDEVHISGVLVLNSREIQDDGLENPDVFLLDLAEGEGIQIASPGESQIYHSVSPDRKLLAYLSAIFDTAGENIIKEDLVIANADGKPIVVIPVEDGWGRVPGWLDNEHVVIDLAGLDPEESISQKPATLLALNPFTREREVLRADFPNISVSDHPTRIYWEGWSARRYDPLLTRTAYFEETSDNDWALALWDLENHKLITRLMPYRGDMPLWSPDGSRLVVNAPSEVTKIEELFLISRDGQIEQLTNLRDYADQGGFWDYSWSPDGRYIAALMFDSRVLPKEMELVITDTDTKQMTNYCLKIDYGIMKANLIWSPDGNQLILGYSYLINNGQDKVDKVLLIDLTIGFVTQIAEEMEPMGWMLPP